MIINLGLDNEFIDLFNINSNYKSKFNNQIFNNDKKRIIEQIILNRTSNLKFIISKIISIINSIRYNKNNNIFGTKENEIINEFRKVLKNLK